METSAQATIVKIAVKQAAGESKRNVEIENKKKRGTERQGIEAGFPQLKPLLRRSFSPLLNGRRKRPRKKETSAED